MNARSALETLVVLLLIVFAASLIAGQALGQPVLLGYVETGSMEPTLEPGDGFIAIPMEVAGPVEPGDVIVFDAQTLHGGGLTTHRVVDSTAAGFITKGDANAVTDQDGSEPQVKRGQVVAVAYQLGGDVVTFPQVGTVVEASSSAISVTQRRLAILTGTRAFLGTKGLAYVLFIFGVLAYALSTVAASGARPSVDRSRSRGGAMDTRVIIVGLALLLVGVLTVSMLVPAGVHHFDIVSSEVDAAGHSVIRTGDTENLTYQIPSNGLFPVVAYLSPHTEGVAVTPRRMVVPSNSRMNATVSLTAPDRTGYYERAIVEHRYLAVLPPAVIDALYRVHPWLPILAIDTVAGTGFGLLAVALLGWGPIRVDSGGGASLATRLRRRFR